MLFLFGAAMDRVQVFPGAIPLETDLLNTNKNTMVGLAKLAAAMLGTSTQVNGLSVIPTGPASLQVNVTPGEIYQLVNLDGTAYSSLAADTTHQIVKQGILLDQVALSCPAPATAGFSINYLIEATYSDVDALPVVLPYYNASNPAVAYSGPANAGTTNNTVRQGKVTLTAKAGIAATTGAQTTPAPDAGYVGLYVVTVANGQTQITAPNIVQATSAPVINTTLLGLAPIFTVSPLAPTPSFADNSAKIATTSWFYSAIATVATAAGFAITLGSNGYIKFPSWLGSLVIQWGNSTNAGTTTAVSFPIAFPTTVYSIVMTAQSGNLAGRGPLINYASLTASGFSWGGESAGATVTAAAAISMTWIAIGK